MSTKQRSEFIYCLKGIAIISVIYAHCPNRVSYSDIDYILDCIRGNLGTVGVPIFFLISGWLFNNNKSFQEFWGKKIKVLIPWGIWGTLVWLYQVARKGFGYAKLGEWLLGKGTYLWYMRTIVLFWFLFYWIKKEHTYLMILGISIVYHIFACDMGISTCIDTFYITNDLMCHMAFFVFGICLRRGRFAVIADWLKGTNKVVRYAVALFCIGVPVIFNENKLNYKSPLFIMFVIGTGILCIDIAKYMIARGGIIKNSMVYMGKNSFLIYLVHMPIAGIVSNVFSRSRYTLYLVLLYPMVALAIVAVAVWFLQMVCKEVPKLSFMLGVNTD